MIPTFAFAVHPLAPWQRRLLGVRHRDRRLLLNRPSERVTRIATLTIHTEVGPVRGHILGVPDLPDELVADQQRALRLQAEAARLARDLGATALGLGSALAVVGGRGRAVTEHALIPVTTGHAATAWACAQLTLQVSGDQPVGVLGFRGTVGDAVAGLLAGAREVLVEARGPADARRAGELGVSAVPRRELLERCRVIAGASTTGPLLVPGDLAPGTTLLDVANPPTLSAGPWPPGVVVLAGETLTWPGKVVTGGWGRLWRAVAGYEGGLAYACLAEPLAMAALDLHSPSAARRLEPDTVRACGQALTRLGFAPALHRRRVARQPADRPVHPRR